MTAANPNNRISADWKFLSSHALFGGLSEEDLKAIAPLIEEENFARDTWIVEENSLGDRLYFIVEGSVGIYKDIKDVDNDGQETTNRRPINRLDIGATFGEMEIIDIQRRSASVRALEDTKTLTLTNKALYQISVQRPQTFTMVILNLARELSRRIRRMDLRYAPYLPKDYTI